MEKEKMKDVIVCSRCRRGEPCAENQKLLHVRFFDGGCNCKDIYHSNDLDCPIRVQQKEHEADSTPPCEYCGQPTIEPLPTHPACARIWIRGFHAALESEKERFKTKLRPIYEKSFGPDCAEFADWFEREFFQGSE